PVRCQEESRVLDTAGCDDVGACHDGEAAAGEGAGADLFDVPAVRVRVDRNGVRMEVDRYVGSRFDRSVVAGGEAASVLADDLGDDGFDRIATKRQDGVWAFRAPAGEVPVGDRQAGLDSGARVIGIEIGPGDWPTAFRDPVAGLEIDRLERSAEPAPVVRRAAEVAKSGCLQWEIQEPDDDADVQVVDLVLVFEAAAFEDDDLQGRSGKLTGDRH